ncbi:MAG: putative ABC transporter ATP-binding protein [Chloroflexi bacterium]|nr:putative ABC transporter ATP-binding protein [Chloroflexota bacterium]
MGFFSNLNPEDYDREYDDRELVSRIFHYLSPHQERLIVISILLILVAIGAIAMPILVSEGVDRLAKDAQDVYVALVVGLVVASGFLRWGANWIRRRLTVRVLSDVVMTLRTDAFRSAAHHDLSFYDKFSSGRVVSRITSDTRELGRMVVLVTDLISQLAQAIILGIFLARIETRLFLYVMTFLPIVFVLALGFRKLARNVTREGMKAMAKVNATIKETVSGMSVAKNFRQEAAVFDDFSQANQQSFRVNVQRGLVLSLVFPVLNAFSGIGTAILVYVGGMNAAQGVVTVGSWYLFILSLDRFFFPVLNLSAFWAQIQAGLSASERVFALIDAEPAVVQRGDRKVSRLRGEIRIENLNFYYEKEECIFRDFNLHIQPGESVALVGHTGAGKSSIAMLIARFYEFQSGQVYVDEYNIRNVDLISYRQQLGLISQMPFLFSGTVAENIRYACQDLSDADMRGMATKIGDGSWLETLPQGLETQVGERGGQLSMGQRQLVALLRVLGQHPAIFILDEATASIDPFTEWQIQQALDMILADSTSILIAHRLSTVKAADRIIVLEEGRIIEEGDHESLLTQSGHYATLYNTYFRHQSLEYIEKAKELAAP